MTPKLLEAELGDRLARCELPAKWSRDDARRWWESRLDPLPPVMLAQPAGSPVVAR